MFLKFIQFLSSQIAAEIFSQINDIDNLQVPKQQAKRPCIKQPCFSCLLALLHKLLRKLYPCPAYHPNAYRNITHFRISACLFKCLKLNINLADSLSTFPAYANPIWYLLQDICASGCSSLGKSNSHDSSGSSASRGPCNHGYQGPD